MHVVGNDNDFAALYIDTFGSFGGAGGQSYRSLINLRSARGTLAAPLPGLAGDEVGRVAGRGYNGTAFTGSLSALSFMLAEDTTATNQGSYAIIRTTAIGTTGGGSVTVPPETVRFQPSGGLSVGDETFNATDPGHGSLTMSGNLGIGTTSPYAKLSVVGEVVSDAHQRQAVIIILLLVIRRGKQIPVEDIIPQVGTSLSIQIPRVFIISQTVISLFIPIRLVVIMSPMVTPLSIQIPQVSITPQTEVPHSTSILRVHTILQTVAALFLQIVLAIRISRSVIKRFILMTLLLKISQSVINRFIQISMVIVILRLDTTLFIQILLLQIQLLATKQVI